ncbi:MAG TPA: Crp/Fnr family transcriptional regulator [Candidatus Limnocylindrales bacterium]|nr:Crp/Fnr family transcriptional regulator [Candidatus Limnocylindrales bacterium]
MAPRDRSVADTAPGPERTTLNELLVRALPGAQPTTIDVLTASARIRHARAGERIYRQGDPVPLTLLMSGYGAFRRTTENGQLLVSGIAAAGLLVGYSAMASSLSSVEFIALTECDVAQWQGSEIRALAGADPGLAFAAIDSMAASLHLAMERIEGFLHQDARRRVIRILARHRDLFFGDPAILTRSHLPSLVGTSREMTARVLRELEREGTLTRVGRSGLTLLRPDRLESGAA